MKTLRNVLSSLGSLGCVAAALFVIISIRDIRRTFKALFTHEQIISVDTLVTDIRRVGFLKPLKVVAGGIDQIDRYERQVLWKWSRLPKASLVYQYKGMAEYVVDVSQLQASVLTNEVGSEKLEISLPEPRLAPPRRLNMKDDLLWVVKTDAWMRDWEDEFYKQKFEIMDKRIRDDIDTFRNRSKAKEQTEVILADMFSKVVRRDAMIFRWRD